MSKKESLVNWSAWFNMMGPNPVFHVKGEVDVGDFDGGIDLVHGGFQKKNPPILILNMEPKTIFVPRESDDNVLTLHYSEQMHEMSIGGVVINDLNGSSIHIKNITFAY